MTLDEGVWQLCGHHAKVLMLIGIFEEPLIRLKTPLW